MIRLGSISGMGLLPTGAQARYQIRIWQETNGFRSGEGELDASYPELHGAFSAGNFQFQLETGEHVELVVTNLDWSGQARIKTSGPVPGFTARR